MRRRERGTASLLRLVADAVERGYEAEMVERVLAWRVEAEAGEAGHGRH